MVKAVNGVFTVTAGILDRATHQPCLCRLQDGIGAALGIVAKTILQIGGHRQGRGIDNGAGIVEGFFQAHGAFGVRSPQAEGQAGTGGGQGLEAQAR
ncbi:hypothetical protein D3C85_1509630 [compost metagenome]